MRREETLEITRDQVFIVELPDDWTEFENYARELQYAAMLKEKNKAAAEGIFVLSV